MKHLKAYENANLEEHLLNSIKAGRLYKVKELIENKFVNKNCTFGNSTKTPLMNSVSLHKKDIVEYLISIGVDIDYQESFRGDTALMIAALDSLSHYDLVRLLIDAGANWYIKNHRGQDFMDMIIFDARRKQIMRDYPEKYDEYLMKKNAEKYNL